MKPLLFLSGTFSCCGKINSEYTPFFFFSVFMNDRFDWCMGMGWVGGKLVFSWAVICFSRDGGRRDGRIPSSDHNGNSFHIFP